MKGFQKDVVLKVDKDVDASYINITPEVRNRRGSVKSTTSFEAETHAGVINVDFDHEGFVIGIELLGLKFRQ